VAYIPELRVSSIRISLAIVSTWPADWLNFSSDRRVLRMDATIIAAARPWPAMSTSAIPSAPSGRGTKL
jgi:hypothetical protein